MLEHTTISWLTFFAGALVLLLVWFLTTRTRIGKIIIDEETPWSVDQWRRLLLVLLITLFILVNPLFHLMTAAIIGILYYFFVHQNFLRRNIRSISLNGDSSSRSNQLKSLSLICEGNTFTDLNEEKKALNRCLFSFPHISHEAKPRVNYQDNYHALKVDLYHEKYKASFINYLQKEGFTVKNKNQS